MTAPRRLGPPITLDWTFTAADVMSAVVSLVTSCAIALGAYYGLQSDVRSLREHDEVQNGSVDNVRLWDGSTHEWGIANNGADLRVVKTAGSGGNVDLSSVTLRTGNVGFQGSAAITKPTVTGSRGGNAALASLLTALANYGLITDSTTA